MQQPSRHWGFLGKGVRKSIILSTRSLEGSFLLPDKPNTRITKLSDKPDGKEDDELCNLRAGRGRGESEMLKC